MIRTLFLVPLPAIIASLEAATLYYATMYPVAGAALISLACACVLSIATLVCGIGSLIGRHYLRLMQHKPTKYAHENDQTYTKIERRTALLDKLSLVIMIVSLVALVIALIVGGKGLINVIVYVTAQ